MDCPRPIIGATILGAKCGKAMRGGAAARTDATGLLMVVRLLTGLTTEAPAVPIALTGAPVAIHPVG
jgi:hypothetical protein